jgi:hypothetical protein
MGAASLAEGGDMTEVQGWIVIVLIVIAIFSQWFTAKK